MGKRGGAWGMYPVDERWAMPCCVPQELPTAPDLEYQDPGIWSPHRTMKIWRQAA